MLHAAVSTSLFPTKRFVCLRAGLRVSAHCRLQAAQGGNCSALCHEQLLHTVSVHIRSRHNRTPISSKKVAELKLEGLTDAERVTAYFHASLGHAFDEYDKKFAKSKA
jgi:transcriptional regulator NrdR family protein